jgi:alpha-L-rhamnosidase
MARFVRAIAVGIKLSLSLLFFLLGLLIVQAIEPLVPTKLHCEYLSDPAGIDVLSPRLDWILLSDRRGEKQIAYRIVVATTLENLTQDRGDLWDSGKIISDENAQIVYGGHPLQSRTRCFWKVRVWNKAGQPSPWSKPAFWSMGLLQPGDWQAQWISDSILANPANYPLTPIHCYRSRLASSPDTQKWIVLDLGTAQKITSIDLIPARPDKLSSDVRTVMFPLRFKIEAADDPTFAHPQTLVDQTAADFTAPRSPDSVFSFSPITTRYVRVLVTRLARWDAQVYGVALGGLTASNGDTVISQNTQVQCSDSIESTDYSKSYLGVNKKEVAFGPEPAALKVGFPGLAPPQVSKYPMLPGLPSSHTVSRVAHLRREFILDGTIKRATLYVTARGFYECRLNGQRVGNHLLDPGYTDYAKRIEYQTFDVTHQLHSGRNALGALLGYGWYAGHMNLSDNRCIDGFFPLFLAQLEVELADGRRLTLGTDEKWRTTLSGPIRWSDLLDGEGYDSRMELAGWDQPNFNDHAWPPAYAQPRDNVALVASRCQPVRVIQEMKPIAMTQPAPGVYVYDFGQEFSGYCRIKADGPAGTKISVRHAELLSPDGHIDVSNLWGVAAEDDYVLDGKGPRSFEPHFTYHGFRYVEVTGLTEAPGPDAMVGINIRSDLPTTGEFTCSNDLYNKIMTAARWTQWNLLFNVPAGCAARAERLAWLGDIRPCVQTAMFNMDAAAFFNKYTIDIRDEQTEDGRFCDITPHDVLRGSDVAVGAPGWADAGVSLPWNEFENYGDHRILEQQFDAAKRWVDFLHAKNPNLLWLNARGNDWGDWLSGGQPSTPKDLGATAFFAHDADLVSQMATVLGRKDEAATYHQLFDDIRHAFIQKYVAPDGTMGEGAQGSYTLALKFHLLDEPLRSKALSHLLEAIQHASGHPTTGFWSSVEMLLALSDAGQNEVASKMVNLTTQPSWGGMIENGGTTFWEDFHAYQKGVTPPGNVYYSLNHWTHSAVGEWLWRNVAGLNPDPQNPGYRSIIIRPRPSDEVHSCQASYDSIRGPIDIQWQCQDKAFTLDLHVPVNATATVYVPAQDAAAVQESAHPATHSDGVEFLRQEDGAAVFQIASGHYHFTSTL